MTPSIDLNADLGELPGPAGRASDRAILEHITSCAIACGGHAGDAAIMAETLRAGLETGTLCGAHPGYPDREGFGRRSLDLSKTDLAETIGVQLDQFLAIAEAEGAEAHHVKPHGALYNDAAKDRAIAETIAQAVARHMPGAALVGQPGSAHERAAENLGIPFLREGFIDRLYTETGRLVPRGEPGAVLETQVARQAQAHQIVFDEMVQTVVGKTIPLTADTLCLHGDSPGAAETAAGLGTALKQAGAHIEAAFRRAH